MSAANTRPSWSSLGKNSTVQSQSSSSCQYGSMSCCRLILSVSTNLDSPETVAETRDTSGCHSAWIRHSSWLRRTTDYATVLLPLPGISNDLEVVRLL